MRSVWMAAVIAACGGPQGAGELGTNRLKVEWQTTPPEGEDVKVTLVVDGQPQELGMLSTTADPGVNGACRVRKADAIATELVCGATSSYNYFVAELKAGTLLVTRVNGVNDDPNAEERKVVVRTAVTQTSFTVLPYTAN